ncbi:MAG: Gfo/Idh/MocA family oxidoreductase [Gammaproteobacteria bacterium]|nr:Gfo/Idh/MocA family oxidoreductase [Gammaproteobacteria bacterium]
MQKVNCAVIGVGYLGKAHAEKFSKLENVKLIGVCDTDAKRSQEIANLFNTTSYTDFYDLLGKVSAVSIAASTTSHYKIAKAFLENNAHVLVEKPITATVAEAEELITLAKKNHLILQVGHIERFNPVFVKLHSIIKQPLLIESTRLAPFKLRGSDVNVVLDLMIHDIDLVQNLVNSPIKNIYANGSPVLSSKIDIASARIEFNCGCVANFTASRISAKPARKLRVFQHQDYFTADLHNKILAIHRKGSNELFPGIPELIKEEFSFEQSDALFDEISAFLEAIIKHEPPVISGEDGKNALITATEITRIAKENFAKIPIKD